MHTILKNDKKAGCIQYQGPIVFRWNFPSALPGWRRRPWSAVIIPVKKVLVGFHQHIRGNPLTEQHKGTGIKRWFLLVTGKPDKILQVWGFLYLFYQFAVRKLELRLDDKGTKGHTERFCNISGITREQTGIFFFKLIPWDTACQANPAVPGVHMEVKRLVKIGKRMLYLLTDLYMMISVPLW